jgi:hypothetical protein
MATDAPSGSDARALLARLRPRRETVVFLVTVALLFWRPFGAGE